MARRPKDPENAPKPKTCILQLVLPPPRHEFLQREAMRYGVSLPEMVRRIIDRYRKLDERNEISEHK